MQTKKPKVVVVMPAYNAVKTLCQTYDEVMAQEIVDSDSSFSLGNMS